MNIGKITESVLKRSVLKQLKSKNGDIYAGAAYGEDCAFFSISDTSCMVSRMEEAILAADASGGYEKSISQAMTKCMNNLYCAGATPALVMTTFFLPSAISEDCLRQMIMQLDADCRAAQVVCAGGQTQVTDEVLSPVLVITGLGNVEKAKSYQSKLAGPDEDVVLSKWVALEGTGILANRHRDELYARYPAYMIEEAAAFDQYLSIRQEAATAMKSGVCAMHDVSKGGIFGALWELSEAAGVGLKIDLKKIPLRQETVEVCEQLGVNPYELLSGGCLLMTTKNGKELVEALHKEQIPAVVIGKTTKGKERIVVNEEEVRYLDRPRGDELDRYRNRKE